MDGNIVIIAIAVAYIIERLIYYWKDRGLQKRKSTIEDFDKMLSDFNVLKDVVASESDTTDTTATITDNMNRPLRKRRETIKYFRKGLLVFMDLSLSISDAKTRHDWIDAEGNRCFDKFYYDEMSVIEDRLNHYFLNLYDLIKQVEEAEDKILKPKDKAFHIARVRRSLSTHEIMILFYYCLDKKPLCKQLKHYIEKYHLFEGWPFFLFDQESVPKNHFRFYDSSAFGKNRNLLP